MKIRSKISSGILLSTLLYLLLTLATFIVWAVTKIYIFSAVFVGLFLIIILPLYLHTNYKIKNGTLYINFGLFIFNYAIPCYNIISMTDVYSNAPAPALSGEKLRIKYVKNGQIKTINISPADKQELKDAINQQIQQNKNMVNESLKQIDKTQLQTVIDNEAQVQNKMDKQIYQEQQKQLQKDIKENYKDLEYLEKRAQKAVTQQYITEQKQAIKQANAQLLPKQMEKFENGRNNLQRKQLSALIELKDKQEKEQRKAENAKWEQQKREQQKLIKQKVKQDEESQKKKQQEQKLQQQKQEQEEKRQKEIIKQQLKQKSAKLEKQLGLDKQRAQKLFEDETK